jgi:DNA-3-methyladenine glycosylase
MYYARGGDSLNFSCQGDGNAVLIKSGFPLAHPDLRQADIRSMQKNNPSADGQKRPLQKLCAGQTLLCRSLGLKVPDWNGRRLHPEQFRLTDDSYRPAAIIQTTRLGINPHRDAQLPYRFIDRDFAPYCTKNPCRVRNWQNGREYLILAP